MYRILLATRSPLYAPIYHAWVSSPQTFRERVALDFAVEGRNGDDLVSQTLAHCEGNSVLMAVGDLTRLTRFIDKPGYDRPIIVGGFIDKMCLWLATGSHSRGHTRWETDKVPLDHKHHVILSHPNHMTSYHVIRHYLKKTVGWDDDAIKEHIFPVVDPGFERQYFKAWDSRQIRNCQLAYMTSEIPHREYGESDVIGFWDETEFQNVSMTGIFASEMLYADGEEDIKNFCSRVKESIRLLVLDGDRVPFDLYSSSDLMQKTGLHHDHAYLCRLRRMLVRISAYSTNLALSRDQLEAMLKIKSDEDVTSDLDKLVSCMAKGIPDAEPRAETLSRRLRGVLLDRECVRRRLLAYTGPIKIGPFRSDRRIVLRWSYLFAAVLLVYFDNRLVVWDSGEVAIDNHWYFVAIIAFALLFFVLADAYRLIARAPNIPFFSYGIMAASLSLLLYAFAFLYPGTFFEGDDLFVAVLGALVTGAYAVSKGLVQRSALYWKNLWSKAGARWRACSRRRAHRHELAAVAAE
jgi:hypothetical protein